MMAVAVMRLLVMVIVRRAVAAGAARAMVVMTMAGIKYEGAESLLIGGMGINEYKKKTIRGNLKLDEMAFEWMEKLNAGGWMQSHFIF